MEVKELRGKKGLSEETITLMVKIVTLHNAGLGIVKIAKRFKCSRQYVYRLLNIARTYSP